MFNTVYQFIYDWLFSGGFAPLEQSTAEIISYGLSFGIILAGIIFICYFIWALCSYILNIFRR